MKKEALFCFFYLVLLWCHRPTPTLYCCICCHNCFFRGEGGITYVHFKDTFLFVLTVIVWILLISFLILCSWMRIRVLSSVYLSTRYSIFPYSSIHFCADHLSLQHLFLLHKCLILDMDLETMFYLVLFVTYLFYLLNKIFTWVLQLQLCNTQIVLLVLD